MPKNTDGGSNLPVDNNVDGVDTNGQPVTPGGQQVNAGGERRGPGRLQNEARQATGEIRPGTGAGASAFGPTAADGPAAASGVGSTGNPGSLRSGGSGGSGGKAVGERKKQFLIAPRHAEALIPMGLSPLSLSAVEQALRNSPDIEVIDTVGPKGAMGALGDGMGAMQGVLVARMTDQKAGTLHQQGQGRLLVERDQYLGLMDPQLQPNFVTSSLPRSGPAFSASFTVLGADGAPVAGAEVSMFGSMLPATGSTDDNGSVTLSLYGETAASIRSLYVKPKADYWSFYQRDPDLSSDEPNTVALKALSDWPSLAGFPQQKIIGWGQKAMRMDQLPASYRGQGVKVAVIDSGAATSHASLNRIHAGFDIINKRTTPETWNDDVLGHGSHCCGVIGGAELAFGIRGFAPEAELHACKLFPGGQVSQLIDALEYCIEKGIDVVNLSLGGSEPSEALEQQIQRARRAGIACIVAAGNSGGAVQYPASSPNVLAVAAIGKLDEFPPDSYHAQTLTQNVDANGYFSASFSCFGPQVGVCGPGVAIASTVPPNNYAAWDGTSMAAPHITGLATLVLAHHPEFQSLFRARNADRVARLFQVIRASARRVSMADTARIGVGLPDALIAVGLQPSAAAQAMGVGGAIGSLFGRGMERGIGVPGRSIGAMPGVLTPIQQQYLGSLPFGQMMPGLQIGGPFMGYGTSGW